MTQASLRGLLYPLWDAGWQVGHAVRNPKEAVEFASRDLDAATSILSARYIAGDRDLSDEMIDRRARWLKKDEKALVRWIVDSTASRYSVVDRAGWSLAPDIKEDVGGLRDLHMLGWLETIVGEKGSVPDLINAGALMLAVREALHAEVRRKTDRVHIDLQPTIASRLGIEGDDRADRLMERVHSAARTIEYTTSTAAADLVGRVLGGPRRSGNIQTVAEGVSIEDGMLTLAPGHDDVASGVCLLAARASTGRPLSRRSLKRLEAIFVRGPLESWDRDTRDAFFDLLEGRDAASALETLDHVGGWPVLVPEWSVVRGRPQHDPYHRYTVDGHLFRAVSEITSVIDWDPLAASSAEEAGDLRTLRLAALLHDVGKGSREDHSVAGERIARAVCERIGLAPEEADEVAALVRWHLLLPDTATRRDLDDGAVISGVADIIGTPRKLRLLYILSAADGRATGPEGWSDWKATLVAELFRKTLIALETGETPARSDVAAKAREVEAFEPSLAGRAESVLATLPPSYLESSSIPDMVDEVRLLFDPPGRGEVRYRFEEGTEQGQTAITVCVPDRPGTLARTAGVLALNRVSVLRAQAFSTSTGLALERIVVAPPDPAPWEQVVADLEAVYSGRLAIDARLGRKAVDYRPRADMEVDVRVLQDASEHSTVVEVRAPDALGLMYALCAALSDLDLDIHVAKIDTLGERVVDVFYVRTAWGSKLDTDQLTEVETSIHHRVAQLFD